MNETIKIGLIGAIAFCISLNTEISFGGINLKDSILGIVIIYNSIFYLLYFILTELINLLSFIIRNIGILKISWRKNEI